MPTCTFHNIDLRSNKRELWEDEISQVLRRARSLKMAEINDYGRWVHQQDWRDQWCQERRLDYTAAKMVERSKDLWSIKIREVSHQGVNRKTEISWPNLTNISEIRQTIFENIIKSVFFFHFFRNSVSSFFFAQFILRILQQIKKTEALHENLMCYF